jgi:hypothetical protein
MENPKVKKRRLVLNDMCDDEYEEYRVGTFPSPPPSMVVPMDENLKNMYLVRECYVELYERIMASAARTVIVTGNPGVGKSAFYVYFYTRLLSDDRIPEHVLVYENSKEKPVLYVDQRHVIEIENFYMPYDEKERNLIRTFNKLNIWHIIDGCNENVKPQSLGRTIVFSSPNRKKMNLLDDDVNVEKLYVPPWTLEELNICRERFYPSLSYEDLVKRFCDFGGVPRFIFAGNQSNARSKIAEAFSKADFRKHVELPEAIGISDSDDYSHRLLHMMPCDNYSSYFLNFASESIGSQIFHNYFTECRNDLFKFLIEKEGVLEVSGYRGYLFEMLAHQKLSAGGTFAVKNLKTGKIGTLKLDPSKVHVFSKASELKAVDPTKYYRPRVKNYQSIDAFKSNWMFQMGIGASHPTKINGIRELLKVRGLFANSCLISTDPICIVFVVPPERFDDYSIQNFIFNKDSSEEKTSSGVIPKWTSDIVQIALKIDFADLV